MPSKKPRKRTNKKDSGVPYAEMAKISDSKSRTDFVRRYFNGKYHCISDALMNRERGGTNALIYIEKQAKDGVINPRTGRVDSEKHPRWKLKVLKDENGNPPICGEYIEWCRDTKNTAPDGRKFTTQEIKKIRQRGETDLLESWGEAQIDEDGCILVGYKDAVTMLDLWGVYYKTNIAITNKPEKRGNKYHWRYMEVPPWLNPKTMDEWPATPKPAESSKRRTKETQHE